LPAPTSECSQLKNQTNKQTNKQGAQHQEQQQHQEEEEEEEEEKLQQQRRQRGSWCLFACLLACTSVVAKNQNKGIWGFFLGTCLGFFSHWLKLESRTLSSLTRYCFLPPPLL
jgi:cation transport ATPase